MPDPLDPPDSAETSDTEPTARRSRDLLSFETFVHPTSLCAHITVHGYADAPQTVRENTTRVVQTSLQQLRTKRNATLALTTPGNCALPALALGPAAGLTGTTALILDPAREPTTALVSDTFGCCRFTSDVDPDATADTWACTGIMIVFRFEDMSLRWGAGPGLLARYNQMRPTDAFLRAHEDELVSSMSSLGARSSGNQGNEMAIPMEHYDSGRWGYGHITWSQTARNKLPANVEDPLLASLKRHSRTGQPRSLWRLWRVSADGAIAEAMKITSPTAASDDDSTLGIGWPRQ